MNQVFQEKIVISYFYILFSFNLMMVMDNPLLINFTVVGRFVTQKSITVVNVHL